MQLKEQPNRGVYIDALRRMGPQARLSKAFELSDMTREVLRAGLTRRHPDATPDEIEALAHERLEWCRSRIS